MKLCTQRAQCAAIVHPDTVMGVHEILGWHPLMLLALDACMIQLGQCPRCITWQQPMHEQ